MRLSRKTKSAVLGFAVVTFAAGFVLTAFTRYLDAQQRRRLAEEERAELRPPAPRAVEVESRALALRRTYSCELAPWMTARAPAEAGGRVVGVYAEAGRRVKAGEALMETDARRARIALAEAEARHAEALRLLGEAERLKGSGAAPVSRYEAAAAEARVAAARLEEARDFVERHTVRAPFDGVVRERLADLGDAVAAGQAVVVVDALDRLRVRFDVAAPDLGAFRPGAVVRVRPGLPRAGEREARVAFVAGAADPGTRLFRVEAELANEADPLPGGLDGTIEAEVEVFPEGPVVPAAAVRFRGRHAVVLAEAPGGGMEEREIVTGPEADGFYPVLSGLRAGERIFVR